MSAMLLSDHRCVRPRAGVGRNSENASEADTQERSLRVEVLRASRAAGLAVRSPSAEVSHSGLAIACRLKSETALTPYTNVHAAAAAVDAYTGSAADFSLPIADSLLDPLGLNMALVTDRVLARGWEPVGFEQASGFRVYRYKEIE